MKWIRDQIQRNGLIGHRCDEDIHTFDIKTIASKVARLLDTILITLWDGIEHGTTLRDDEGWEE